MSRYLLRRLAQAVVVVVGVIVLTFVVARVVPGDPAVAYAGPHASAAQLAQVRQQFGLDKPLPAQLADYLKGTVSGDWGTALHTKRAVLTDLGNVIPPTLELVGFAMLLALLVGIPLGMAAARRGGAALRLHSADALQNRMADALIQFLVRPGLATVRTQEPEPGQFVYEVAVDWPALRRVAAAAGINLDEALGPTPERRSGDARGQR
jgi:ABC-type microcin C transport system permease subunit YejB